LKIIILAFLTIIIGLWIIVDPYTQYKRKGFEADSWLITVMPFLFYYNIMIISEPGVATKDVIILSLVSLIIVFIVKIYLTGYRVGFSIYSRLTVEEKLLEILKEYNINYTV
jgi:hypothetical protein